MKHLFINVWLELAEYLLLQNLIYHYFSFKDWAAAEAQRSSWVHPKDWLRTWFQWYSIPFFMWDQPLEPQGLVCSFLISLHPIGKRILMIYKCSLLDKESCQSLFNLEISNSSEKLRSFWIQICKAYFSKPLFRGRASHVKIM